MLTYGDKVIVRNALLMIILQKLKMAYYFFLNFIEYLISTLNCFLTRPPSRARDVSVFCEKIIVHLGHRPFQPYPAIHSHTTTFTVFVAGKSFSDYVNNKVNR